MPEPYYADASVTLYLGDCREITEWLAADVLVTDPPYGIGWRQGRVAAKGHSSNPQPGIMGDSDTATRDSALMLWGQRVAAIFGDFALAPPCTVQTLVWRKPPDSGIFGARHGWRRDVEAVYLTGHWPLAPAARSAVINGGTSVGTYTKETGHPHAKPVSLMESLIAGCPPGAIADPFAGSGSTLVAARNLGRQAIGVEIEERYCETIAKRLAQDCLPLHG